MSTIILQSLNPVPVEVTYDSPGLNVALSVFEYDAGAWNLVIGPVAAQHVANGTYLSVFTPPSEKPLLALTLVYDDNTFAQLLDGYYPSSRSFVFDGTLKDQLNNIEALVNNLAVLVGGTLQPQTDIYVDMDATEVLC